MAHQSEKKPLAGNQKPIFFKTFHSLQISPGNLVLDKVTQSKRNLTNENETNVIRNLKFLLPPSSSTSLFQ